MIETFQKLRGLIFCWMALITLPVEAIQARQKNKASDSLHFPIQGSEALEYAPFPYSGKDPDSGADFFDRFDSVSQTRYHTTSSGTRYPESTYQENRVFFYFPSHFKPQHAFQYVVYFHGHLTDVPVHLAEQKILTQIERSHKNIIFVAPQFAKNAADSSAGKFYESGNFKKFMGEIDELVGQKLSLTKAQKYKISQTPITLIAYSGGYKPLAYVLDRGEVSERIHALFLVDALYGEEDKYSRWFFENPMTLFVSLYTSSSEKSQLRLIQSFKAADVEIQKDRIDRLRKGHPIFQKVLTPHQTILFEGPPQEPLAFFLKRI